MKTFLVQIWAYDYHVKFNVLSEDNAEAIEHSILDRLGEKDVKWEYLGKTYDHRVKRITYEEVNHDRGPIQTQEVLGIKLGARAS